MIGKLICRILGHRRWELSGKIGRPDGRYFNLYRCPRCGHTIRRTSPKANH